MEQALLDALAARPAAAIDPRDRGLEVLALSYARLIDNAAPAAKYAEAVAWMQAIEQEPGDAVRLRIARTVLSALAEHTVHSDLGPKLQQALESLRLSPKVRTVGVKGQGDAPAAAGRSALDELRARRDRKRHPSDLDSPAP